ncbi:MAG: signal peptidase I [Verrucomicrobia bacterium]|nr:signal peptidase I [Verrucomicrobiota bacterium]
MKPYSLHKCKKILLHVYQLWRKKRGKLMPTQANEIREDLKALQAEIQKKNRSQANFHAHKCQNYLDGALKRSGFQQVRDVVVGLAVALAIAFIIRQCWFELYEIPTGSMRPTFKEQDRLLVSKTNFGINIPFTVKHLYFDPDLAKHSGIIVFSTENMDVHDSDTLYFWIFPGKKQFVKRLMGRPGDTVYFYGGKLYGIDKDGNDISASLQLPDLQKIDHVPMIHFDGSMSLAEPFHSSMGSAYRMAIVHQMNEPVARLTVLGNNRLEGEMLPMPRIHNSNMPPVQNYYELWGIGNFASARIVRKEEIRSFAEKNNISLQDGEFFLELHHHPNLKQLELARDYVGRIRPQFIMSVSIIPLDEDHLKALFDNLYTARFVVKNGYAMRYGPGGPQNLGSHFLTRLEMVPDGTYEYYHGQAYQIKWGGYAQKLPSNHPLQTYSAELVRKFFNYGIEFDKRYAMGSHFETERFGYFRDGDLYLMGAPIFKKAEAALETFVAREKERAVNALVKDSYIPFVDSGPPDMEKIKQAGLLIPPESYLALGDNFAMSADSREFGFVPQGNLRGSPSFIFWPPGPRFGRPVQPWFPWFTIPNMVIWTLALICFVLWFIYHKRHHHLPLKDL